MSKAERTKRIRCFGGWQESWQHQSDATGTKMNFGVYLPSLAESEACPVLYWLSGLTCTEENFVTKSGFQRYAEELGMIVIAPDTSPRGANLPGEDDDWDLGTGAGFYVNATEAPWAQHYRMYDYVVEELPQLAQELFPLNGNAGISGHSMGGHGALVLGLRNPDRYFSISAFAPIAAPTECPWGHKAFGHYLGEDREAWKAYDAHLLLQEADERQPILVDQGTDDGFLEEQLKPELLQQAADAAQYPISLRYHKGYDHSYFFISSFIGHHLAWHHRHLSV